MNNSKQYFLFKKIKELEVLGLATASSSTQQLRLGVDTIE